MLNACIKNLLLRITLIIGIGLIPVGRLAAQTFTNLHSFTATSGPFESNSDGAYVDAGLLLSGNTLYGTAAGGGSSGHGTVFAVNINGTGFTNLHSFAAFGTGDTNSDGAYPYARLILSGNTLYGTANYGGKSAKGTVFAINIDGTGFTNLHSFTGVSDGANPYPELILSGNTLYGTANRGGSSDNGTVFAVNTNGTGFTNLHSFANHLPDDGAYPTAGLIITNNTLYGTASAGGSSGRGMVFALNSNGIGFTNLHSFTITDDTYSTNSDGASPNGLILSGNTLYGVATQGGSSASGALFAVSTSGTGFTNLHNFPPLSGFTNSDGAHPPGLILVGSTLYGTTVDGGNAGNGTIFSVNTNGTGFTTLHSFTAASGSINSDGVNPYAGVIFSGNTLYGTTYQGGSSGRGTVFSLSLLMGLLPQLTITPSGANVILTWPTNFAGFTLQSTTNLVSPVPWSTASPGPIIIGGQNVVFHPTTGAQIFFRLSQ